MDLAIKNKQKHLDELSNARQAYNNMVTFESDEEEKSPKRTNTDSHKDDSYGDPIQLQMAKIENRMQRANEFRDRHIMQKAQSGSNTGLHVEEIANFKNELWEKKHIDTMGKVVMKHTEKEKLWKKQAKEKRDNRLFETEKRLEKEEQKKFKLKELQNVNLDRDRKLKEKFKTMDKGKININKSMVVFQKVLKEQHLFKKMDADENIEKLKRGHSAYKVQLVEKLLEKGMRAREISSRKINQTQMAQINSQMLRSQMQFSLNSMKDIELDIKNDLNQRNLFGQMK